MIKSSVCKQQPGVNNPPSFCATSPVAKNAVIPAHPSAILADAPIPLILRLSDPLLLHESTPKKEVCPQSASLLLTAAWPLAITSGTQSNKKLARALHAILPAKTVPFLTRKNSLWSLHARCTPISRTQVASAAQVQTKLASTGTLAERLQH